MKAPSRTITLAVVVLVSLAGVAVAQEPATLPATL